MTKRDRFIRKMVGLFAQAHPSLGRLLPAANSPHTLWHTARMGQQSETLFVLLPGIQDLHLDFELAGFVRAAREVELGADLVAVDAHIGFYARQKIIHVLREEIIRPARAAGYQQIWLAGASLGGLGSALYASLHEGEVEGLMLMAPYLGQRQLLREIRQAGGLQTWRPAQETFEARLWLWLAQFEAQTLTLDEGRGRPKIFLGFGESDRFAYAHKFLAGILPTEQVIRLPGEHDWRTWQELWKEFLRRYQQMPFQKSLPQAADSFQFNRDERNRDERKIDKLNTVELSTVELSTVELSTVELSTTEE